MSSLGEVQVSLDGGRRGDVFLPRSLHDRMGAQAEKEGRSVAAMVRHACERYLQAPDLPPRPPWRPGRQLPAWEDLKIARAGH